MGEVRELLLAVETDAPDEATGGRTMVRLGSVVAALSVIRIAGQLMEVGSAEAGIADLRGLAAADAAHLSLPLSVDLAAAVLTDPGCVDDGRVRTELIAGGVAGAVLVGAFTSDRDSVDAAAGHACALVRYAAAANPLPTQRHYRLASDPCRDVSLTALANREAQRLMTHQFRTPIEVARGIPLAACACGAGYGAKGSIE